MQFYTQEDIRYFESVEFLYIKTALSGHVLTITLSRPEKRNAFTPTMAEEIIYALAFADCSPNVRCVVIDAEGSVFCAGADLNAFHDSLADIKNNTLPKIQGEARLGEAFENLEKPTIAKVTGPVLAGGFLIICGCTFVFASDNASFSLPEVKRGIWPMQVMASLMPIIPERKILEMAVTGRNYTSQEAFDMGLVTQLVSKENVDSEVEALAELICKNAPLAIRAGISALRHAKEMNASKRHVFLKSQLDLLLKTEDAKEGALAFKEKRSPEWKAK